MNIEQAANQKLRADRAKMIGQAWYKAIANTAFVPHSPMEICDRLSQLSEQALRLLHAEPFTLEEGQAIGAALVDLHYIQGSSLGASVELLARELTAGLTADQLLVLQPRLFALLGGITQGFFQQGSAAILAEQESVRRANVNTLQELYAERQRQQEILLQTHEQLKVQIKERARIEDALRASEEQFRILFEESPVALWVHDGSKLYRHLASLKEAGIQDFRSYFIQHPEELQHCSQLLVPIDVNQQAVRATGVAEKEDLLRYAQEQSGVGADELLLNRVVDIANNKIYGTGTITTTTPEGRYFATIYQWSVPHGFAATYSRIILSFIDITAQKEAEQKLLSTTERLETLRKIESAILQAESPRAIAELALEHMEKIIPCSASAITLFRSSHSEVVILAGRNTQMKPGDHLPAVRDQVEVLKRGQAIMIEDFAALPRNTVGEQAILRLGGRALISVPLLVEGELIGTLSLIDANLNAFSEEDVQITRQVGNSIAIAIHNADLLDKEKKARHEAETLRKVAANLNTSLGQEELLYLILTQLERVLPYDSATIFLQMEDELTVAAHHGQDIQLPELFLANREIPRNILSIVKEQRPLVIPDTDKDPNWLVFPGGEFIKCWMGAPMVTKNKFVGLLMLDKKEPHFYKQQDTTVAMAFANQAAIAIENAELYRETQQYAELLEKRVTERTRELGALYKITAVISQHLELKTTLDKIVAVISEALEIKTVSIQIVDQSRSVLQLAAYRYLSPIMVEYLREQPVTNPLMKRILERHGATLYVDPSSAPELADMPTSKLSSHSIVTPISAKGKNLGILAVAYYQQEKPTVEDLALLASIADHIGVAIENSHLRRQSEQFVVLEERERLARDLHDSATQSLFSLTLFAAAAREHLGSGQLELVQKYLFDLEETAIQTHKEMRLLLYELRSAVLEEEGLEKALQRRIQMVEFRSGIRGHVNMNLSSKLPVSVEQVLFQVANEALNNTLRHSGADTVMIDIRTENSHVRMSIRDNGQGFAMDDADFSAGMGLDNMRQRVGEMGGIYSYESSADSGTIIDVLVPLASGHSPGDG